MSGSGQYVAPKTSASRSNSLQRQIAGRHPELRVEVLVAREDPDIAERGARDDAVPGLAVEAAQRARDVRIDADRPPHRVVQQIGVADRDLRELAAQLQAIARIADVGLAERDRHVEPGTELESRAPGPEAGPGGEPADADILDPSRHCGPPDIGSEPFCRPSRTPSSAVELARVERRHDVRAVPPAAPSSPCTPAPTSNQVRRNDERVDERPLHAVVDRRLVALVDDADRHQHHARPHVEPPREQEVDVGLFELELAGFLESLDQRVFQLQLADEPDAIAEAVRQQQHEAVEIETAVLELGLVEMEVHVARQRRACARPAEAAAGVWAAAAVAAAQQGQRQAQKRDVGIVAMSSRL